MTVAGVSDGQRLSGSLTLTVSAKDNQGGKVQVLELRIDDHLVKSAAGDRLSFAWDASALPRGRHTLSAVARNGRGQSSVRKLDLWAGDVFVADLGSRFTGEGTQLTLRDLTTDGQGGSSSASTRVSV